jgi:hypothetical protein
VLEKTSESENRLVPGISKESESKNQPVPGIQKIPISGYFKKIPRKYQFWVFQKDTQKNTNSGYFKTPQRTTGFQGRTAGATSQAACIAIMQGASVDWPITNCLPMTEHLFISYHMCFILSDLKCKGSTTSSSRNHLGSANDKE